MFCPKCGAEQRDGATFCSSCGSPVQAANDASAAAAPIADGAVVAKRPQSKKALVISLCALAAAIVLLVVVIYNLFFASYKIDEKRFPDPALRQTISVRVDINGDGVISKDEAKNVTALGFENVSSVEGLDIFPNLQELACTGDNLTSVSIDGCGQLKTVSAPGCTNLTTVKLGSNGELETLDIADCPVSEIDVRGASKLKAVSCKDSVVIQNLDDTPLHEYWAVKRFKTFDTDAYNTYDVNASYDTNGNLKKLVMDKSQLGKSTYTYDYDDQGRCTLVTEHNDRGDSFLAKDPTYTPVYNEAGLLTKDVGTYVVSPANEEYKIDTSTIAYNSMGLPTSLTVAAFQGGGYEFDYNYDAKGALTSISYYFGVDPQTTPATSDGAGNITSLGEQTMTYDSAGRLVKFSSPSSGPYDPSLEQTMEYDAQGRLVNAARSVVPAAGSSQSGLASVSSTKFEYDARGMLTKVTPTRTGAGSIAPSYSIEYTRLLLATDTGPSSNFLNLADPLSPTASAFFWDPASYESAVMWMGSMKNVMAHTSFRD